MLTRSFHTNSFFFVLFKCKNSPVYIMGNQSMKHNILYIFFQLEKRREENKPLKFSFFFFLVLKNTLTTSTQIFGAK